jgi:hypothetical protein
MHFNDGIQDSVCLMNQEVFEEGMNLQQFLQNTTGGEVFLKD